jgi:DNA-binding NarL/FixJ family response regulator
MCCCPMAAESDSRSGVLIIDDRPIVRLGLRRLLETSPDLWVCGEAESVDQAVEMLATQPVGIAIVDFSLGDGTGLELIARLQASRPGLPVLVMSNHDEHVFAERALRAGARGYVAKREPLDVVLEAIRRVLAGRIHVSERISQRILETVQGGALATNDPLGGLTDRELQVFELVGRGVSTADIARRLHVSVKTIETYRANIKTKLGLSSASELVRYASSWTERL